MKQRHQLVLGLKEGDRGFGLHGMITQGITADHLSKAKGRQFPAERIAGSLYNAEVATVDEAIAQLLLGLEEQGILEDCLIILTGDHGETFWEHGDSWNHGLWLYKTTTRLPWIMNWPDAPWQPGSRIDQPSSTVDLVPTLCGLLNVPVGGDLGGEDWGPAFRGEAFQRGPVYSVATQPILPALENKSPKWANAEKPHAVRLGPWKLIDSKYNSVQQLFHLGRDPGEKNNLLAAKELDQEASGAHVQLLGLLNAFRASAKPLPSVFDPTQAQEVAARLGAMGYAHGTEPDEGKD
ncbi:MAG: sulfatase-like hydrolase/transferase [bacterium]|nr:sulfatase-like hydrolase/transferase [bacterium]